MANTTVRGRLDNANFPANTGKDVVLEKIRRLPGFTAPTFRMIGAGSPTKVQEDQKFRWKTQLPQDNHVQMNGSATSGDTSLVFDEVDMVQVGQVLRAAGGEEIRVDSIDSGTNTATVTRGFNGTSAASISDNAQLLIKPQTLLATELPGYTPTQYGEFRENTPALMGWRMGQDYWSTATVGHFADGDRLSKAKMEFLDAVLMRQMEVAIWYGSSVAMTASARGSFKGLSDFNTVNVASSVGNLTINAILTQLQPIIKIKGLAPDGSLNVKLYGNEKMQAILSAIYRTYSTYDHPATQAIAPNVRATRFMTDYGALDFVLVRQLFDGELHGIDLSDCALIPLSMESGPGSGFIETQIDYFRTTGALHEDWFYYWSGTLMMGDPNLHFKMTGITTTTSAYTGYIGPTTFS